MAKIERKKRRKVEGKDMKKCQHCQGDMRARGASDVCGGLSWKCRKCGRTEWLRNYPKPPVPLVFKDSIKKIMGG